MYCSLKHLQLEKSYLLILKHIHWTDSVCPFMHISVFNAWKLYMNFVWTPSPTSSAYIKALMSCILLFSACVCVCIYLHHSHFFFTQIMIHLYRCPITNITNHWSSHLASIFIHHRDRSHGEYWFKWLPVP